MDENVPLYAVNYIGVNSAKWVSMKMGLLFSWGLGDNWDGGLWWEVSKSNTLVCL